MSALESGGEPPYDLAQMDAVWEDKRRGVVILAGYGQVVIGVARRFDDEPWARKLVELRPELRVRIVEGLAAKPLHGEDIRDRLAKAFRKGEP